MLIIAAYKAPTTIPTLIIVLHPAGVDMEKETWEETIVQHML